MHFLQGQPIFPWPALTGDHNVQNKKKNNVLKFCCEDEMQQRSPDWESQTDAPIVVFWLITDLWKPWLPNSDTDLSLDILTKLHSCQKVTRWLIFRPLRRSIISVDEISFSWKYWLITKIKEIKADLSAEQSICATLVNISCQPKQQN